MSEPWGRWEAVRYGDPSPGLNVWPVYPAFPEEYRDPEWDGSETEFREKVIPARIAAIEQSLSGLLPEGSALRFVFTSAPDD